MRQNVRQRPALMGLFRRRVQDAPGPGDEMKSPNQPPPRSRSGGVCRFAWRSRTNGGSATLRPSRAGTVGAFALGALAGGAVAFGALAIGRLAIGFLAIGKSRIRRLEIDELVVKHGSVIDLEVTDGGVTSTTDAPSTE